MGVAIDQGVAHLYIRQRAATALQAIKPPRCPPVAHLFDIRCSAMVANITDREAGLDARFSGQSARVAMAGDLAGDGASIIQAGGWNSNATVGHYIERMSAQRRVAANMLEIW